jgi:hypothetical protein
VLCDYAQRWRDGACKGGGTVRLWLLEAWLVVAPARGVTVMGGDGKPLDSSNRLRRRSSGQVGDSRPQQFSDRAKETGDTPSGLADAVRVPLSLVWCKRIMWSDGLFELLSPVPEHCFLLEMPTRDRERWLGKLLAADERTGVQAAPARRALAHQSATQVYVNQIHWESAHELPVDPRTRKENVLSTDDANKYKAMMKKRYAEQQEEALALAAKRRDEARPSSSVRQCRHNRRQRKRRCRCQPATSRSDRKCVSVATRAKFMHEFALCSKSSWCLSASRARTSWRRRVEPRCRARALAPTRFHHRHHQKTNDESERVKRSAQDEKKNCVSPIWLVVLWRGRGGGAAIQERRRRRHRRTKQQRN